MSTMTSVVRKEYEYTLWPLNIYYRTSQVYWRGKNLLVHKGLTLYLLVSSADSLCKQLELRSGLTKHRTWSESKLFDTLMEILRHENLPRRQRVNRKYLGLNVRKPVFRDLQTTEAQTSMCICAVWPVPLLFVYWKVSYLEVTTSEISISLCSWAGWFEDSHFLKPRRQVSCDVSWPGIPTNEWPWILEMM